MKPGRRTGPFRWLWVVLNTVYATLKISVQGLWHNARGTLTREYADERLRWWARRLLQLVGLRYQVHNPHNWQPEPGKAYILMCNHASHYDIPMMFCALPGTIRMVAKKELFRFPVWGPALKATEFVAIDRRNREQAMKDLDNARLLMQSGVMVWIAPEGTRSRDGYLGPLKKGGFMLGLDTAATIIPIGIRGAGNVLPPDTRRIYLGCEVDIHIGQPVECGDYDRERRNELLADVESRLLELAAIERRTQAGTS